MKKTIALMLAVCCILGVLVMGVSAAKADEVAPQARYDPRNQVCTSTVLFRRAADPNNPKNVIGQFEPGEHMIVMDFNTLDWLHGIPGHDSKLYQTFKGVDGYSIEACFQPERP